MPSKTDEIIAAFEELLKRRGTQKPTDRLGLERPVVSRDFDNKPMAGWEKAAALIGAAVSPASTIASMVLSPPQEESLFDRAITGPDGKTYYPEVSESVVPKMRKAARKAITPNPVVAALQRAAKKGPLGDPANDIVHQKINDRDFLVHATRPRDAKKIIQSGTIMPGSRSDTLPENILKDPLVLAGIKDGSLKLHRSSFSGRMVLSRADGHEYELSPKMRSGTPGTDEAVAPGVSLSRQMVVPELSPAKSYRFLLDPKARKTFATAEPGFGKAHRLEIHKAFSPDPFESEQRTFGTPYPVARGNRAITAQPPAGPTEEYVRPGEEKLYRATMGNERFRHIRERIGEVFGGDEYRKYVSLKNQIDDIDKKLEKIFVAYKDNTMDDTMRGEWLDLAKQHQALSKELKSISLPSYLKY